MHEFKASETNGVIEGLYPTSTFALKLVVCTEDGDGEPSDETHVDTLVANCGPQKRCSVM